MRLPKNLQIRNGLNSMPSFLQNKSLGSLYIQKPQESSQVLNLKSYRKETSSQAFSN